LIKEADRTILHPPLTLINGLQLL